MTATNTDTRPGTKTYDRRWFILAVLCLSLMIVTVGNASLNLALPTLARELGATESQLQWVVAIYALVFAGLLFPTGALGDRYGRKGALQAGLLVMLAGAVTASFASEMWQLIACRAVMGIGAALIMPSTLSILINVFPAHERTKAIAIWASVTGAGGALGQVISGVLLERFWWGAVFLVNVPLILTALVGGYFLLPRSRDPKESPFDPGGAILSTVGLVALVYGLIEAPERGWLDPLTLLAFAVCLVALTVFVFYERRIAEPMLDIDFFRNRAFSTATGCMILVFMSMYGLIFLITQYMQLVQGHSAFDAAMRLLPTAIIMLIVAPLTPRLSARLGANRAVALGMMLDALGMLSLVFLTKTTPYPVLIIGFCVAVTGIAMTMSPMTAAIMSAVPTRRAGAGSSMNDATRELGSALGVAVLGSIAATHYSSGVRSAADAALSPAGAEAAQSSLSSALTQAAGLPSAAGRVLTDAANDAFLGGIHIAMGIGAVLVAGAALVALKYLPHTLRHRGDPVDPDALTPEVVVDLAFESGA